MTGAELGPGEGPPVARSRSSLGHALKKLMLLRVRDTEQSLAVKAIARRIRVSPASVYAYLSGATLPPVERLDDLLSYLEVSGPERRWFQDLRDDTGLRFPARPKPGSPEALADSGPPLIEIALPDGTVRVADIDDAASAPRDELDLSGDYVIEELSEHVQVSAERTFPRVDYWRRIRALKPGVRRFSYAMECPPDSGLRRVTIEANDDAVVAKVVRVPPSAYIFHFGLPRPLGAGEVRELSFAVLTEEDENRDDRAFYGKQQFVATEKIDLSVEFADGLVPAEVRWFAPALRPANFPDGYAAPPENIIDAGPGGRYQKAFEQTGLPDGRLVGLMWDY